MAPFDLRQNLLMTQVIEAGQPFYYFYNACGREYRLFGLAVKAFFDRQYDGRLYLPTIWGFTNKPTKESFSFDDRGGLLLNHNVTQHVSVQLELNQLQGMEGHRPICGLILDENMRRVLRIHLKAVNTPEQNTVWFEDLSVVDKRIMLNNLGHGWLRLEQSDEKALNRIHTEWLRKHDENYKYTHNAIGIDPTEKLPADLYDDHGRVLRQRQLERTKTVEMMAKELANLIRVFELNDNFDHEDPMWELGMATIANHYIYAADAEEKLKAAVTNSQFRVNIIYALAKDLNWVQINDETADYQASLVRRLMQELRNEIERKDNGFVVEDSRVYIQAIAAVADDEEEIDEEEDDTSEKEVLDFLRSRSEDALRAAVIKNKMASQKKAQSFDKEKLVDLCADFYGSEMPEDFDEDLTESRSKRPTPAKVVSKPKKVKVDEPALTGVKFPPTSSEEMIDYETLRFALRDPALRKTYGINPKRAAPKELLNLLFDIVFEPKNDWFNNLNTNSYQCIACTLVRQTKVMRSDSDYLKEVIKRSLRMLCADRLA